MEKKGGFLRNYSFSLTLLFSIALGAGLGILFKEKIAFIKPLGDIFLNLLFTAVVPLVFFSISSAIAEMSDLHRLGKIMSWMVAIFIATGILSSLLMALGVTFFPPVMASHPVLSLPAEIAATKNFGDILKAFTVPDFVHLLSKQNMLALIVFAILVGLAASLAMKDGKPFLKFLVSAKKVMLKLNCLIIFLKPFG